MSYLPVKLAEIENKEIPVKLVLKVKILSRTVRQGLQDSRDSLCFISK